MRGLTAEIQVPVFFVFLLYWKSWAYFFLPRLSRGRVPISATSSEPATYFIFTPRRRLPEAGPITIGKVGVGKTIAAARTLTVVALLQASIVASYEHMELVMA